MTTPSAEELANYILRENVRRALTHIMEGRMDAAIQILSDSVHYQAFLLGILRWDQLSE